MWQRIPYCFKAFGQPVSYVGRPAPERRMEVAPQEMLAVLGFHVLWMIENRRSRRSPGRAEVRDAIDWELEITGT